MKKLWLEYFFYSSVEDTGLKSGFIHLYEKKKMMLGCRTKSKIAPAPFFIPIQNLLADADLLKTPKDESDKDDATTKAFWSVILIYSEVY